MIRLIAAIDSKRGMANESGIPWKLPTDTKYFRDQTRGGNILMGLVTYEEFRSPVEGQNFVANDTDNKIRSGFTEIRNLKEFIKQFEEDLWIIGGAGIFAQTIEYADELYLTRIKNDFKCTKFFPAFEGSFELIQKSPDQIENGITFRFEVWKRKKSNKALNSF